MFGTQSATGEQIWALLLDEPEVAKWPEAMVEATKPFALAMPEILADLLPVLVTVESICKAKLAYIRYCMTNEYAKKLTEAVPEDTFGFMTNAEVREQIEGTYPVLVETLEGMIANVPEFLQEQGVDELEFLQHPQGFAIKKSLITKYKANNLTIGDLLRSQPMVIFDNSSKS